MLDSEAMGETKATKPGDRPAPWTLHSAFENPKASHKKGTAPGPRESCEVRCLVLWAPEDLATQVDLKGVTGLAGGDQFYDAETGKYVDQKDGVSAVMQEGNDGSHDYSSVRGHGIREDRQRGGVGRLD